MEKQILQWILIGIGVVVAVLDLIISESIDYFGPPIFLGILILACLLIGFGFMFTKKYRLWIKILLILGIAFLMFILIFFFGWGIKSGFRFSL